MVLIIVQVNFSLKTAWSVTLLSRSVTF